MCVCVNTFKKTHCFSFFVFIFLFNQRLKLFLASHSQVSIDAGFVHPRLGELPSVTVTFFFLRRLGRQRGKMSWDMLEKEKVEAEQPQLLHWRIRTTEDPARSTRRNYTRSWSRLYFMSNPEERQFLLLKYHRFLQETLFIKVMGCLIMTAYLVLDINELLE